MKVEELTAIIDAFAPEIRAFVAEELKAFAGRLEQVEALKIPAPLVGEKGEPGLQGVKGDSGDPGPTGPAGEPGLQGEPGPAGQPGPPGERGETGPPGERGEIGPQGEPGERGEPGLQGLKGDVGDAGADGQPGRDGIPGRDGLPGLQGEKGQDGRHGTDGVDGLTPDDFEWAFDPETRNLTIALKHDGAVVKAVTKPLEGILLERGTFDDAKQYARGDVVIFHGSSWIAKTATSAQPDVSKNGQRDWRLLAQRGRDGKQGLQGLKGHDGKDGRPGVDLAQRF